MFGDLKIMQPEEMLGDYKILELVGKGGQGEVYKALDTKLKRFVAIKVFTAGDDHRRQKLSSFKYEARLASALSHPNICTVYGLFEDENHTYIVMEYIEGKNLYELAFHRPLEIKSALQVIIQVTEALITAHARGIIHRDIKPRNVMLADTGRAVVLDFGLAKLLENEDEILPPGESDANLPFEIGAPLNEDIAESLFLTVEGLPYGSPASSPPEMALGARADHRADVYSTGILLYLLLTGTYPFLAKTAREVRDKVINEEPVPVSVARKTEDTIPLELIAIVRRALRKNPDERFQTMTEMRAELIAVLNKIGKSEDAETPVLFPALSGTDAPHYAAARSKKFRPKAAIILSVIAALVLALMLVGYIFY